MSEFLPACHNLPPILMALGCALAVFVIMKWSRSDEPALPKWRWGDTPRRQKRDDDGLIAHVIGAALAALAIAYALNNPICG